LIFFFITWTHIRRAAGHHIWEREREREREREKEREEERERERILKWKGITEWEGERKRERERVLKREKFNRARGRERECALGEREWESMKWARE